MEPRIQYAKTEDGVSIAFWTLGEGTPLVITPWGGPFSHIQLEWQVPQFRVWYESLARKRMLVSYNDRGSALSGRNVSDYSVDALVLDLNAVVERVGLKKFDLLGMMDTGPASIAYAARHPDRVSHLVLWCTYAEGSHYSRAPETPGLLALMDKDWNLFTETWANAFVGWGQADLARRLAALWRECCSPEIVQAFWPATLEYDVTRLLPHVKSPTLVLHPRRLRFLTMDVATELASGIPNARLTVLEGSFLEHVQTVVKAIDEFLDEAEEFAAAAEPPEAGAFRTIFFTDVEESTALTQRLGDAKAREVLRTHERIVREALKAHGGAEVKTMGDGFMASFTSATRALECAIALQRAFAEHNESGQEPVRVRVGLNAGEPIAEEEDLFGTAVILAARIAGKAEGGEILAPDVVRQLVAGKDFLFADRGETALRGFEDPVRLYEVRWRESAGGG